MSAFFALIVWAENSVAGWNPNAWPSEERFRISTGTVVVVSNLYGRLVTETWSQSSTADHIPELSTNWSAGGRSWIMNPLPGSTNATRAWTNQYLSDLRADVDQATLDGWATNWSDTNSYSWDLGTNSYVLTTIVSVEEIALQTNLTLGVRELWAWDTYMALAERWDALQTVATNNRRENLSADFKPRFYRNPREELIYAKEWIVANCGSFRIPQTNDVGYLNAHRHFLSSPSRYAWTTNFPSVTTDWICAQVGGPTNWFDTDPDVEPGSQGNPWRSIGGSGYGYQRVVTGSWTFASDGTSTVYDTYGAAHVVAHTNGEVVAFVCTNEAIQDGFTSLDYGYRYVPGVFSQLVETAFVSTPFDQYSGTGVVRQAYQDGGTGACEVAALAWAGAQCNPTNGQTYVAGWGALDNNYPAGNDWYWNGEVRQPYPEIVMGTTNVACSIEVYLIATTPHMVEVCNPTDYVFEDVQGIGFSNDAWIAFNSWPATNLLIRGGTNEWAWGGTSCADLVLQWDCSDWCQSRGAKVSGQAFVYRWAFDY